MADTRINALSTATSSVSDDYVPIDGTTNGTRKLSAYSPSFGGNATVGGTLTVNSSVQSSAVFAANNTTLLLRPGGAAVTTGQLSIDTSGNANAEGIIGTSASSMRVTNTNGGFLIYKDATPTGAARFTYNTAAANTISLGVYDGASWTDPFRVNTTQALVTTTTASTSTSTGALVVGNGTSGGLGVGGAANVGGVVKGAQNTHSDASVPTGLSAGFQVDVQAATTRDILTFGDSSRHGLIRGYQDGAGTINWRFGRYTASTFAEYVRIAGLAAADAVVSIYGTTASDATSNGALIISGGAGISGAVNVGTFYGMVDGVTAPATTSGYAKIYVDSADGDLKVKFGDGTVKTIATDS